MTPPELNHPSYHRVWTEVDLGAIRENVARLLRHVGPGVELMAPVKANAYGHGAAPVARAALAGGATRLAVATCLEGQELREAGVAAPVHVIGALLPEEVEKAVFYDLVVSVHEREVARLVSLAAARQERTATVHLKIDTGMGRLGVLPEDAATIAAEIAAYPHLDLDGVFMHFAEATDEPYSRGQLDRFRTALDTLAAAGVKLGLRHAANSTSAILCPEARFDCIRPGLALYGMYDPPHLREQLPLLPALSWRSSVVQVKEYPADHQLGYNRTYRTTRATRVAVLPMGYADGYQRGFSNRADVLLHGCRARVVGMVSMDYTMVDVTDIAESTVGSEATLIGSDGEERIFAEELAGLLPGAIPYEITCGIGPRTGRSYRP